MKTIPKIIISGSIAIDRIMNFKGRYKDSIKPEKLHALSLSVLLHTLEDTHGGTGANIAYTLALLGERPFLLGSVGEDGMSYIKKLSVMNVDISHVYTSKKKTASFTVMTDLDDNQIGGFYPGAMGDSDAVTLSPFVGEDVLVTISAQDPDAMKRQVEECNTHKIRLFYDVSQQVSNIPAKDLKEGVSIAELLIANDYELSVLCDKIQESPEKLKTRIPIVVTTLGKNGSVIEGKLAREKIIVGSVKPKEVKDPTGAGDAYRAGFLYGYVRERDLKICGQMGAVAASFAIEHHGTQNHNFSKAEFEKRYESNFGENIKLDN